jgi:hypothetical protein
MASVSNMARLESPSKVAILIFMLLQAGIYYISTAIFFPNLKGKRVCKSHYFLSCQQGSCVIDIALA